MRQRLRGFSLVELSIVLVILGLLVGGVLSGKSLIRASQLRSVMTQQQSFRAAALTFKEKYFYLPGDLPNATQFWGEAADTTFGCTTDSKTVNGNGDGIITAYSPENGGFWVQLANAKLIAGQYRGGTWDTGCAGYGDNPQAPYGKLGKGILWGVRDYGVMQYTFGNLTGFDGDYNNTLVFPTPNSETAFPARRAFNPQELFNIDTKLDDGKPATGKVVLYTAQMTSFFARCVDVSPAATSAVKAATLTANYLTTSSEVTCGIAFRNQF